MQAGVDAERGRNRLQEYVCRTECYACAECYAQAALSFPGREGHADGGEDEGGEGDGKPLVVFHLEDAEVLAPPVALLQDVVFELLVGHGLLHVAYEQEVVGLYGNDGVYLIVVRDGFPVSFQLADGHVVQRPLVAHVAQCVVGYRPGRQVRDEFLVLELVQVKVNARLADTVEMLHVGNHAFLHLQLHAVGIRGVLLVLLIEVLEDQSLDASPGDNLRTQVERGACYDGRADDVGQHQTAIAHARAYHGYNLAAVSQLSGKENNAEEDEERAEEIGVVGDEVEVVVHDALPGCMIGGEAVHVLVKVEHHGNTDDKQDGEEVSPQELANQVSVYALQERDFHKRQGRVRVCWLPCLSCCLSMQGSLR